MTLLLAALLAGLSIAALTALPRPAGSRLADVGPSGAAAAPRRPWSPRVEGAVDGYAGWGALRTHPWAVGAGVGLLAWAVDGLALGVLAAMLGAAIVRWQVRRSRVAAAREERARAVEACLAVAAELRAGRSSAEALRAAADVAVGPAKVALSHAARTADLGGDVTGALTCVDGSSVPELLRAIGACWAVCASAGSGLAPAVERLADGLVADAERRRAVEAELAGPRATAGLLALLPIAGVLLAIGLGADPWHVLFHTSLGTACLFVGVGLDLLGLWLTTVLADRALQA